jgi:hypothetical protein
MEWLAFVRGENYEICFDYGSLFVLGSFLVSLIRSNSGKLFSWSGCGCGFRKPYPRDRERN